MAMLAGWPLLHGQAQNNQTLLQRTIPRTAEKIPVIGLGTWETFDVASSQHALLKDLTEVLKVFSAKGASVVDSSPMYGFSEKNVGQLSTELNINQKLFVATKVWTSGKEQGEKQINTSFDLLQRKQLDLLQIHNLVDWQVHLKTLRRLKENGKVRYIGITHYLENAYGEMEKIMRTEPIDFIQVNYNVLDRESEVKLLPLAQERKIGVLINQPFGYGKLFQRVKDKPLPAWVRDIDCQSWAQCFLKFIVSHPAVTCVIPGTGNPAHMIDNLGAGLGRLPDAKQREQLIKELA